MTFDFHADALDEYQSAASWYEEQRSQLGMEFIGACERLELQSSWPIPAVSSLWVEASVCSA